MRTPLSVVVDGQFKHKRSWPNTLHLYRLKQSYVLTLNNYPNRRFGFTESIVSCAPI